METENAVLPLIWIFHILKHYGFFLSKELSI